MSRSHLPAGQSTQGPTGGVPPIMDMGTGPGGGGGPRRRQHPQYMPQYQQQMAPMYANYMPYAPQPYYGVPPQYQNGAMPGPGYMSYQGYARSPPAMHQYVPMMGVSASPSYHRPSPQSPVLATQYQPPPVPAPMPSHTPTSSHSSQVLPSPTPPTPQSREPPPPQPAPVQTIQSPPVPRPAFRPPLPWLSRPDLDFPTRSARSRRRRKLLTADSAAVSLPHEQHGVAIEQSEQSIQNLTAPPVTETDPSHLSTVVPPPHSAPAQDVTVEGGAASQQPLSPTHARQVDSTDSVTSPKTSRGAHPAMPAIPLLPRQSAKTQNADRPQEVKNATDDISESPAGEIEAPQNNTDASGVGEDSQAVQSPPSRAPPSSWAELFAKPSASAGARINGPDGTAPNTMANGSGANSHGVANIAGSGFSKANANSLADAIEAYKVNSNDQISFLEPRGLINTGNMCYMNSVLQVLVFCVPFWDFLDLVSKKAAHSFKSDTPLIDAMVMFMHEYKTIRSASSVEALRRALKNEELERYGEPFTPEFVYEAIRQVPRFDSMRRGHQQDAEEFLGFLLQSLDDECTQVMNSASSNNMETLSQNSASHDGSVDPSGDWLEVGRKQRAAVTRSSGSNSSTPITSIFGGLLRSEFRVPGLKDSITTEPYQPLQLDIGSPDVRNVVDALRGLTRPERLQGNFNSPRGADVMATKQVFIESLPPVLILHLKRFQFDAEGNGTVKIWKKVGYPLELEIPREALSRQKRQTMGDGKMPRYRLISVVYHHGKNASGGHYTVDVRRQEGNEWIRLDDTVLRRVRSEDVAEPVSDEEPKEPRKDHGARSTPTNRFGAMDDENTGDDDEDGWKQVTTSASGNKRWSSVVNGSGNTSPKGKQTKENIKENKVAYLLFYQRV